MKITESSPQICWFFGVHLKGDVTMSFASPFCPQIIKQITSDESASAFGSVDNTYLDFDYSGYHKNLIQ